MTILDRYLARTILLHTLMVMAVLLALMTLVTFIGQQDDIGQGSYDVTGAFLVTLLQLPQQAYQLLPIGALIGAIIGLGGLARDSELTVVRAAGVSVGRIAVSAALAGVVVAALLWVIGEYFAPPADQYARQFKIFSRYSQLEFTGSRSAWVREGPYFINVRRQAAENLFGGIFVYELDAERRLTMVGRAETAAQDSSGRWVLTNYAETRLADPLPLTLQPGAPSAQLYPGGSASVAAVLSNPNPYSVRVASMRLDTSRGTGGFDVDSEHGDCDLSSLSFTTQDGAGEGWNVPPKTGASDGSLPVNMAGALTMGAAAGNACQGAVFTVHLTVSS